MRVTKQGQQRGTEGAWQIIWSKLLPPAGGSVLDVGCGEHIWTAEGWSITRCDNLQPYPGVERGDLGDFDHADINYTWPYDDDSFSGVIAADVIEHVESIWHFMREAIRVSRDFVIISTPNTENRLSRELFAKTGHLWGFTPHMVENSHHMNPVFRWQIEMAAHRAGWRVGCFETTNEPFYNLPAEPAVQALSRTLSPTERSLVAKLVAR